MKCVLLKKEFLVRIQRMKQLLLILLFIIALPAQARADIINDMFRVECMPELNIFRIENLYVNGPLTEKLANKNSASIAEKYGLHSYDEILKIAPDFTQQWTKSRTFECRLSSDNNMSEKTMTNYLVKIEGVISNGNPEERCGGWHTIAATISTKDKVIFDKIPFSIDCNDMREINYIVLNPHEGYININATPGVKSIHWLSDPPATAKDIYLKQEEKN
jgi:hypothetical protein